MAQLLSCENLEEIENFLREQGYVANDFSTTNSIASGGNAAASEKRHLQLDEIAELLLVREDLELTKDKINRFLADLN